MMFETVMRYIGRLFLAVIFLFAGYSHIVNFQGIVTDLQSLGVIAPQFFLGGATILVLVGAVSILFETTRRLGALSLIVYLIPVTILFHLNFSIGAQVTQFLKNLTILGGLISVLVSAPSKKMYSVSSLQSKPKTKPKKRVVS